MFRITKLEESKLRVNFQFSDCEKISRSNRYYTEESFKENLEKLNKLKEESLEFLNYDNNYNDTLYFMEWYDERLDDIGKGNYNINIVALCEMYKIKGSFSFLPLEIRKEICKYL